MHKTLTAGPGRNAGRLDSISKLFCLEFFLRLFLGIVTVVGGGQTVGVSRNEVKRGWEAVVAVIWVALIPGLVGFALYNGTSEERIFQLIENGGLPLAVIVVGIPVVFLYRGSLIDFVNTYRQATDLPDRLKEMTGELRETLEDSRKSFSHLTAEMSNQTEEIKVQLGKVTDGLQANLNDATDRVSVRLKQEVDHFGETTEGMFRKLRDLTYDLSSAAVDEELPTSETDAGDPLSVAKEQFRTDIYRPMTNLFDDIHRELFNQGKAPLVKRGGGNRAHIIDSLEGEFLAGIRKRIDPASNMRAPADILATMQQVMIDGRSIFRSGKAEEVLAKISNLREKASGIAIRATEDIPD